MLNKITLSLLLIVSQFMFAQCFQTKSDGDIWSSANWEKCDGTAGSPAQNNGKEWVGGQTLNVKHVMTLAKNIELMNSSAFNIKSTGSLDFGNYEFKVKGGSSSITVDAGGVLSGRSLVYDESSSNPMTVNGTFIRTGTDNFQTKQTVVNIGSIGVVSLAGDWKSDADPNGNQYFNGTLTIAGDWVPRTNGGNSITIGSTGSVTVEGNLEQSGTMNLNIDGNLTTEGDVNFHANWDVSVGETGTWDLEGVNLNINQGDITNNGAMNFVNDNPVVNVPTGSSWDCDGNGLGHVAVDASDLSLCTKCTGGSAPACGAILPIELTYFDVQRLADGFQYNWQTLSEKDNDYFTVEYSYSLKEFQEITRVNSSGNSFETIDYESFSNDWFLNGVDNVIYFRLKQVDYDGNFTYSHIVSVSLDVVEKQGIELFPNPATDQVTVRTNVLDEDVQHSVSILSLLTQEVIEEKEFTGMETKIDVSSLSEGIYLVKLARDTRYVRLVVQ